MKNFIDKENTSFPKTQQHETPYQLALADLCDFETTFDQTSINDFHELANEIKKATGNENYSNCTSNYDENDNFAQVRLDSSIWKMEFTPEANTKAFHDKYLQLVFKSKESPQNQRFLENGEKKSNRFEETQKKTLDNYCFGKEVGDMEYTTKRNYGKYQHAPSESTSSNGSPSNNSSTCKTFHLDINSKAFSPTSKSSVTTTSSSREGQDLNQEIYTLKPKGMKALDFKVHHSGNKKGNKSGSKPQLFKQRTKPWKKQVMDLNTTMISIDQIISGKDQRTTLMVRHIPNKYSLSMLTEELNAEMQGKYDILYLPLDFVNNCNLGYAFINFVDYLHIVKFYDTFKGKKWRRFNSEKICELAYAKIQGKSELIAHFEKGSVFSFDSEEKKPLILPTPNPIPLIEIPNV